MSLTKRWLDELIEQGAFEDLAETDQLEPFTEEEWAERQERADQRTWGREAGQLNLCPFNCALSMSAC